MIVPSIDVISVIEASIIFVGEYVKKKKEMDFQSVESLPQVVNIVNEAAMALNDKIIFKV